jgi:hypothetical protein
MQPRSKFGKVRGFHGSGSSGRGSRLKLAGRNVGVKRRVASGRWRG